MYHDKHLSRQIARPYFEAADLIMVMDAHVNMTDFSDRITTNTQEHYPL